MNPNSALLSSVHLSIGYPQPGKGARILAGPLDFELYGEELVGLLGPNGAGKSTLVRTLAGLQPALTGSVRIGEDRLSSLSAAAIARKVSIVLTERVEAGNLSVAALVALGRYPHTGWFGHFSREDKAKVQWALDLTGTRAWADRYVNTLSDGERQKVMLARALAQDTPLIILDEPTAHLDLPNRVELFALLRRLSRETRKAILLSTHELDLALQSVDRLLLMPLGGAVQVGVPEDLVLNGAFELAFQKSESFFDRRTGTFRLRTESQRPIRLEGEGTAAFWTRRALEREGFSLHAEADIRVEVRPVPAGNSWVLHADAQQLRECASIGELLRALRTEVSEQLSVNSEQ